MLPLAHFLIRKMNRTLQRVLNVSPVDQLPQIYLRYLLKITTSGYEVQDTALLTDSNDSEAVNPCISFRSDSNA